MDYKLDLIYKKKDVLGLDIGSTSVKIAQLKKKKGRIHLAGCSAQDLDFDPFDDGVISDPKRMAEVIKGLLKQPKWGKFSAKRVAVSIPETKIFTRVLELPKMSEEELKEAINWEADQYIQIPTKELYIDWEIIGPIKRGKENVNEILMVAVPKKIVESYLETLKILKFEPFWVEMNLQAVTRAMISNKSKDEAIIVVDIGGSSSGIAVFDHKIKITGSIPFGGSNIVDTTNDKKKKIVFPEAGSLADEIKKLIDYYENKKEQVGKKITKVILCGGSASHPGITEEIGEKIKIPVEVGNPWVNISTYPLKPVPKSESPRYANAIGLALMGVIDE